MFVITLHFMSSVSRRLMSTSRPPTSRMANCEASCDKLKSRMLHKAMMVAVWLPPCSQIVSFDSCLFLRFNNNKKRRTEANLEIFDQFLDLPVFGRQITLIKTSAFGQLALLVALRAALAGRVSWRRLLRLAHLGRRDTLRLPLSGLFVVHSGAFFVRPREASNKEVRNNTTTTKTKQWLD